MCHSILSRREHQIEVYRGITGREIIIVTGSIIGASVAVDSFHNLSDLSMTVLVETTISLQLVRKGIPPV